MTEISKNPAYIKKWFSETFPIREVTSSKRKFEEKLFYAAWIADRSMLEALWQSGWGITGSISGWTALHSAVWNMHSDVVRYLLEFGKWKDWQNKKDYAKYSLLHFAVRNHDLETLQLLLNPKSKADVNFTDSAGRTALHEAAICGNIEATRVLLDSGAEKGKLDLNGRSPRMYAGELKNKEVVKELLLLL
jgi:hypothetical protein